MSVPRPEPVLLPQPSFMVTARYPLNFGLQPAGAGM